MKTFDELLKLENRTSLIGMKADSLIRNLKAGFNVPNGFVALVGESAKDIEKYANEATKYAVRSSGTSEDLQGVSFAGQYDTYLNVQGYDNLKKAIVDCQASINNARVKAYAEKNGIDMANSGIAVIVQEMVPAEKAGVAFSVDSVNGLDKEIIIEAVEGLGEQLVSGQVTPDYYSYNWYDEQFSIYNGGVLTKDELKKLSVEVLKIQEFYGFPVDVEWAIVGDEIFILQSRPITTINYKAIPDEWTTANFRDGGVSASACKTLMGSLYALVFDDSFAGSLKTIKLLDKNYNKSIYGIYFGRPYWNLTNHKECYAKLPGYVEGEIDEDTGYDDNGVATKTNFKSITTGFQVLSTISKHIKNMEATTEIKMADLLRRFEPFENIDLSNKTGDELHKIWIDFIKNHYYLSQCTYFKYIFCNMILSTLFKDKIKKYLPDNEIMNLYIGLTDLSHMRPIYEAWDIAHSSFSDSDVTDFIKKYRFHSQHELDISFPNWDETPNVVKDMIHNFAKMGDDRNPKLLGEKQKQKYFDTLAKVPQKLHKEITQIRSFLWWREEFRDISTKSHHIIRNLTLALGKAWENEKILDCADDIFHLSESDIEVKQNLKAIVAKNRKYYASFLNYKNPNEIGNRHTANEGNVSGDAMLKGVPCSGETLTGTARVVKDIHDSGRLEHGDILVTKCTDPAWAAVFSKISGVITETGGMLSHAAVIAREYGISCILVVKGATTVIKDGDTITMNCKTGEIYKEL